MKSLKYAEATTVYELKQNKTPKREVYRNMSSNCLNTQAVFLDFVIFGITVKLFFCGILKFIFLKGFPAPIV